MYIKAVLLFTWHLYLNIKHGIWVNIDVQGVKEVVGKFQLVLLFDLELIDNFLSKVADNVN